MEDPCPVPPPTASRRDLLAAGASLAGLGGVRAGPAAPGDALDRAYERVLACFPDVKIHRSNHAAMVCEALDVLGRADAIAPWLDRNLGRFERDPRAPVALDGDAWRDALGRAERIADWQALFRDELERDGHAAVLRRWVPRLAPGLAGAATHGLIRTAHAARALGTRDCDVRRRELATGLAYWAATWQELPCDGSVAPEPSVEAAFATLETNLPDRKPPGGNIVAGFTSLAENASFASVAGRIDVDDPLRALSDITTVFARVYLRHPERRIHFTHAVTAPSALRLLVPYLDDATVAAGVRLAWQAAAGLYVLYGDPRNAAPAALEPLPREELAARAVASGGAHAIKLVEACLREHAVRPSPDLLAAARDAAENQTA